MDYPALVVPELTAAKIQTGEALIRALDHADMPLTAAFWLWSGHYVDWRLVLASPIVDAKGSSGFYGEIVKHVNALRSRDVNMMNVVAASPTDPIVAGFRSALGMQPGINAIRRTGSVVGSVLVPDAHIYRLS